MSPPEAPTRTSGNPAGRDAPWDGLFICQFNIAVLRFPFHSREMFAFRERLESVHEAAESCPGYLGRYHGEHSAEGYIMPYPNEPRIMGNLTAWRSVDELRHFVFHDQEHREVMLRKRDWFIQPPKRLRPYNVLYIAGQLNLSEAMVRLEMLRNIGPSGLAFTWKEASQCGF